MSYFFEGEVDKYGQPNKTMNGLRAVRKQCDMTIQELADKICVSKQIVSAWENGVKEIPESRKKQLSQLFGIDSKYFGEVDEGTANDLAFKATERMKPSSVDHNYEKEGGVEQQAESAGFRKDELRNRNIYDAFVKSKELQKGVENEIHGNFVPRRDCSIRDYMNVVKRTTTLYKGFNEVIYSLNKITDWKESSIALYRILETLNAMVTEMGGIPDRVVDEVDQSFDLNKDYITAIRETFRKNLDDSKKLADEMLNKNFWDRPLSFKMPGEDDILRDTAQGFINPEGCEESGDDTNVWYEKEDIDTSIDFEGYED